MEFVLGLVAVVGAYLVGSIQGPWVAAVLTGRQALLADARRALHSADAHYLLQQRAGRTFSVTAGVLDVLKGFLPLLLAALAGARPSLLALMAVAVTAGHSWPLWWRRLAGRGLAASAGAFLVIIPREMLLGGAVSLAGTLLRASGPATTVGFGSLPITSLVLREPAPYVLAALAVVGIIAARRLEGIREDLEEGAGFLHSVWCRLVHDVRGTER